MKIILLFLFVLGFQPVRAATYYLSVLGDDAHSPAEAQSPSTPWKSLARLNEFMGGLHPGDTILFRRGDVFQGTLRVTASGNAASALVFGAYGSGSDPVISGLMSLQNWYAAGSNIWETILPVAPVCLI